MSGLMALVQYELSIITNLILCLKFNRKINK